MSDKYELFLDRDKKVKIAADEEGNFFAEANGNRIKLGDSGLQKFGEGGVLEDVGDVSGAVGETKTFSFSQDNIYVSGLRNSSNNTLDFTYIPSYANAFDQALSYISSKGLGQRFLMQFSYELKLDFAYQDYLWSDPSGSYYPGFQIKKRWSSVTGDSLEILGRWGSISKARYNQVQNAGLPITPDLSNPADSYTIMHYRFGDSDYTNQYGVFSTNKTDHSYGVPDDSDLFPGFEIFQKGQVTYNTFSFSNTASVNIRSDVYTGVAYSYSPSDVPVKLLYCNGTAVNELMVSSYNGSGGAFFFRSITDDGNSKISGTIKVTLI